MTWNSIDIRQRRRFGLIAFAFFGALACLGLWAAKPAPTYFFGLLSFLGFGLICLPGPLGFVYRGWLKVAHLFGRMVTSTMLILAYYLVMTPSAMIKRVLGGLPIPVRPDKDLPSYWVTRNETSQPRDRFLKRY